MPLVLLWRNPKEVSDQELSHLIEELPIIVQGELNCEKTAKGHLILDDISIKVLDNSFNRYRWGKDLEIVIFAGNYHERLINKEERAKCIAGRINNHLKRSGYVWVIFCEEAFCEFGRD